MKLYVNEKLFSIHRRFFVKDETGNDVFEISSKVISIGDKTTISDMNGNQIAYIEQEIFNLMPTYNIYIDNNCVCKIKKKLQLFKNDYELSNGYNVAGNLLMLDFSIYDGTNTLVGSITRKFLSIGDKYEINIPDQNNKTIILAIVVAIANDINRTQASNSMQYN